MAMSGSKFVVISSFECVHSVIIVVCQFFVKLRSLVGLCIEIQLAHEVKFHFLDLFLLCSIYVIEVEVLLSVRLQKFITIKTIFCIYMRSKVLFGCFQTCDCCSILDVVHLEILCGQ